MPFAAPILLAALLASSLVGVPAVSAIGLGAAPQVALPRKVAATADATKLLRKLPVEPEVRFGYDRSLFVHWTDANADGCDTRREVLLAEAVSDPAVGPDCFISGGSWWSAYDGASVDGYPSSFDVDHMVPLAEAWDSGARAWPAEIRTLFANDLGSPASLIAVTASTNRSKSDKDPASWLPRSEAVCGYVADWVRVKFRWGLSVDRAERKALGRALSQCDPRATLTR